MASLERAGGDRGRDDDDPVGAGDPMRCASDTFAVQIGATAEVVAEAASRV